MSLILVAKNEFGNKQKANPPHPPNQFKGKAILCASPLPIQSLKMSHESHVSHVPLGKGNAAANQQQC